MDQKTWTPMSKGQSSSCLLCMFHLPATDSNTEPPLWHYSLRRLTSHLAANGLHKNWPGRNTDFCYWNKQILNLSKGLPFPPTGPLPVSLAGHLQNA